MSVTTFMDFCSGIGGGRLGLEQAGLRCVGYSDSARLAPITYRTMFDAHDEPNLGNLKKLTKEKLPQFDLLIAGFPCQTFSVIGKKEGFSDDRGQIIFHLSRILREAKPKCFILENVRGLVTHDKGKTIKTIIKELEDSGYNTTYKVLTSLEHGVPQMRQRVYFVGFRKDIKKSIFDFEWPRSEPAPNLNNYLIDGTLASKDRIEILEHYLNNPTNKGDYSINDIKKFEGCIIDTRQNDIRIYEGRCPTLRAQRDGILYIKNSEIYKLTGFEALLLQGFPKEYALRVKNTVSDRHLLMQAGNAMTVNVIRKLGESILTFLNNNNTKGDLTMANWQTFEEEATTYLNTNFSEQAYFIHKGSADSTIPDILVQTKGGSEFYIEAKQANAQSGQFVLLPDIANEQFVFSSQNKTCQNQYTHIIIEHMNQHFESYKEAGTKGKIIDFPGSEEIFTQWIIDYYQNKGVKFFITENYTVFPISDFANYFDVTATYRVKRSGSSATGKANQEPVSEIIYSNYDSNASIIRDGAKLYVASDNVKHDDRFKYNGNEFMISERTENYEIRKLSNTFNANVIFSINKKGTQKGLTHDEFADLISE